MRKLIEAGGKKRINLACVFVTRKRCLHSETPNQDYGNSRIDMPRKEQARPVQKAIVVLGFGGRA